MSFPEAGLGDVDPLLEMMRALYASDGVAFDEAKSRHATHELIASAPDFGRIWLIESQGRIAGYVVLTFGFSLEYGGKHGFIDELFVREGFRGRGLGSAAVEHCVARCRHLQMSALLLEVDLENPRAYELYRRLGFQENRRRLMMRKVQPSGLPISQ